MIGATARRAHLRDAGAVWCKRAAQHGTVAGLSRAACLTHAAASLAIRRHAFGSGLTAKACAAGFAKAAVSAITSLSAADHLGVIKLFAET